MNKISGVYLIKNKIDGKCYVGVSVDIKNRWRQHKSAISRQNNCVKIANAIRYHGLDSFEFSVIEQCSKHQFDEKERFWIEKYNSVLYGYNLTNGGNYRKSLSFETKKKMSDSHKNKKLSESHRKNMIAAIKSDDVLKKISASLTGRKRNPESIKKTSDALRGRIVSKDTRLKISLANTGKTIPDEVRKKMSEAKIGKKVSDETKNKISEYRTGKKHSKETIAKMKDAWIVRKAALALQLDKPKMGRPKKVQNEPNLTESGSPSSD